MGKTGNEVDLAHSHHLLPPPFNTSKLLINNITKEKFLYVCTIFRTISDTDMFHFQGLELERKENGEMWETFSYKFSSIALIVCVIIWEKSFSCVDRAVGVAD